MAIQLWNQAKHITYICIAWLCSQEAYHMLCSGCPHTRTIFIVASPYFMEVVDQQWHTNHAAHRVVHSQYDVYEDEFTLLRWFCYVYSIVLQTFHEPLLNLIWFYAARYLFLHIHVVTTTQAPLDHSARVPALALGCGDSNNAGR